MAPAQRIPWRERAGLAAIACLFLAHAWALAGVTEDAYISFRYAEHWVDGRGLVWNLGEAPVEGYTNFLWMAVSALSLALGIPAQTTTMGLGTALGLAGLGACHRFASEGLELRGAKALLPPALLALAGPWAAWAASGMEATAFGALTLFAALDTARALHRVRPSVPGPPEDGAPQGFLERAAFWCLLASLTRPEGVLVTLSLGAATLVLQGDAPPRRSSPIRAFLIYAVPATLYFVWRLWYFGDWLPNTFHAKTGDAAAQVTRGAAYLTYFAQCFLLPLVWLPFAAIGARRAGARAGIALSAWPRTGLLVCAFAALPYAVAIVLLGGDYMAMTRFCVPLLPFAVLTAGACAGLAWDALRGSRGRAGLAAGLVAAALAIGVQSTPLEARLYDEPWFGFGTWRGVQREHWQVARLRAIGRFFARHGRPGESVATRSIGAIGYLSGLDVHDMHGLTDPTIAKGDDRAVGTRFAGHEKQDLAYTLSRRPTFVVLSRHLLQRPRTMRDLPSALRVLVEDEYDLVYRHVVDEENGERGWFGFLERRDRRGGGPIPRVR